MNTIDPIEAKRLNDRAHSRLVLRLALVSLRLIKRAQAEYDEEVREWYTRGPGRPRKMHTFIEGDHVYTENVGGEGWTFPECIHGSSLWTDYDNICGPCEDGYSVYELALMRGHAQAAEFQTRSKIMGDAFRAGAPQAAVDMLTEWALDALPRTYRDGFVRPFVRDLP